MIKYTFFLYALIFFFPLNAKADTVFDRVMASGVLHCGYWVYPPMLMKDPNTGGFSGVFYELVTDAAEKLNLKIEWREEVGSVQAIEGLKNDRFDAMCTPLWRNPKRAPHIEFTKPLQFSLQSVFVRQSDDRFNGNKSTLNNENIKIVVIEGTTSAQTAESHFPNADFVYLPQSTSLAELLNYVVSNKADATITATNVAYDFMRFNPGKIHVLPGVDPLYVQGDSMTFKKGAHDIVSMFDATFDSFVTDEYISQIWDKYDVPKDMFYKRILEYRK